MVVYRGRVRSGAKYSWQPRGGQRKGGRAYQRRSQVS